MAVSKVILNGDTLIDVTQKTVTSASMLSGTTALKNDGTDITGSIASKTSSDLTASGATVTAPAGYYASSASKSVASGSATTPATSITANPTISVNSSGLISASVSTTKSITPTVSAGYVSSGTAGTATVSGSATQQLTTQAAQTIHPSTTDQTIASGKYLTGTQTVKGVVLTNLTADNIKKDVVVKVGDSTDDDCVTSVTGTLEGGGGGMSDADLKNYIERSNSFTDIDWPDGLTKIGNYAFSGCSKFSSSSLPATISAIGDYAFYGCEDLALASLPSTVSSLGNYSFYNCKNISLTSLPSGINSIGSYTFYGCTGIALTILPNVVSISAQAFRNCTGLALTSLPSTLTSISASAFAGCTGITTISCDGAITFIQSSVFNGDSSHEMQLTSASFPNLNVSALGTVFGNSTAANACRHLEFADVGASQKLDTNCFANCYALETLVLRRTGAICSLTSSAFNNTPMSGYNSLTGTVYVPSALISTYQTATNWSTLYNNGTVTFTAIEGSDYELD